MPAPALPQPPGPPAPPPPPAGPTARRTPPAMGASARFNGRQPRASSRPACCWSQAREGGKVVTSKPAVVRTFTPLTPPCSFPRPALIATQTEPAAARACSEGRRPHALVPGAPPHHLAASSGGFPHLATHLRLRGAQRGRQRRHRHQYLRTIQVQHLPSDWPALPHGMAPQRHPARVSTHRTSTVPPCTAPKATPKASPQAHLDGLTGARHNFLPKPETALPFTTKMTTHLDGLARARSDLVA